MQENLPRTPPRWTRGDVGREIGKWILAEVKEALAQAGIHGRTIDGGHVVGVVPTAASKLAIYVAGVLCGEKSTIAFTDNFECAGADPYIADASDIDLSNTGVTAGVYGDASFYPTLTIDDKGRVTYAAEIASGGGPGASSLDDLTDVTLTGPTNGQALVYDAYTNQWVNDTISGTGTALVAHEEFAPASSATTVTLAHTPLVVLHVSRNGVVQSVAAGNYSVSGATLTFTTAFDGTDRVVVSYAYDTGMGGSASTAASLSPGAHINTVLFDGTTDITVAAAAGTLTGSTLAAGVTASSLTSVGTLSALTIAGNLTFSGSTRRVTGDFSNATHSNRVLVQTSTTNGDTHLGLVPNGTGVASSLVVYAGSNPDSASYLEFSSPSSPAYIDTSHTGAATTQPFEVRTDGVPRARFHVSGGISFLSTTDPGAGKVSIAGDTTITGTLVAGGFTGGLTGNAATATALQTPRTINGVAFDGTANITVPAAAGTLTGSTLAAGVTASSLTSVGANLGVNGTVPAWGGAYRMLSVGGANSFGGSGTASAVMAHNLYYDGTNWRTVVADTGESIQLSGQSIYFQTAPSGSAGAIATGLATRVQINGTGATSTVAITAHSGATGALALGGTVTSTPLSLGSTISTTSPAEAYGAVFQSTFSGSANAVYGIFQRFLTANSYAAAIMYGMYLGGIIPGASNSITNNYGLYVASQAGTGVSTSYGVCIATGSTYGLLVQGGGIGVDSGVPNANSRINVRLDQNTTTTINVVNASAGANAYGGVGVGSDVTSFWMLALSAAYGSPFGGKGLLQCTAVTGLMLQNTANGPIQFWTGTGGSTQVCFVTALGGTYPGFAPGGHNTYDLGQSGNAWRDVWCARGVFNGSHSSLKREWAPVQPTAALAVARATNVGTYRYKPTDELDVAADLVRIGLLADDAHPWLSPDGHNVSPQDTACLALAAIRALADENDSLRRRLDALEARVHA